MYTQAKEKMLKRYICSKRVEVLSNVVNIYDLQYYNKNINNYIYLDNDIELTEWFNHGFANCMEYAGLTKEVYCIDTFLQSRERIIHRLCNKGRDKRAADIVLILVNAPWQIFLKHAALYCKQFKNNGKLWTFDADNFEFIDVTTPAGEELSF